MSGLDGLFRIEELRKKIIFTVLALAVYRVGVHIPAPGVDGAALKLVFEQAQGTLFGVFNMFSGGAFERFSVFALGVMPYISASIIMQLMTVVSPALHEMQKEGEQGRKKITQYTRYLTVLICFIQGYAIATGLEQQGQQSVVLEPGMSFRLLSVVVLTGGTMFLMWLGEQMTERGIGNGISLLIFAGIAANIPNSIGNTLSLVRTGELSMFKLLLFVLAILVTFFIIIYIERGQRRLPIQYAKRIVGRKVYGGQNTHLPLKVNTSGVIPPIFAQSILMFPQTVALFLPEGIAEKFVAMMSPNTLTFNVLFVALIIFFCYFYTAVTFKTDDVADNLKKYGGFIPGIRPGAQTAQYIDHVLTRITTGGAVYIAAICVLPPLLSKELSVPFVFGGTSVLILVGVALDTVAQIETFLITRNYEGFMKHTRVRGRAAYS